MAKRSIINVTDFRGGYSTNIPDERMPGNMVRTGENVYWEDGLRKRKGWSAYGATFPSAADFIFGSIRAYMNGKWTHVCAASLTASSTVIRFMTDNGTAKTFIEIDNSFTVATSVEAPDRFRFALMKINGQDAVCGVDKEAIQKPFVIYYDSGFIIKTIEEYDIRTRDNDFWFAGQYDVSETNPYFDKTSEAQSTDADDFPLASITDGDGFYVDGILTYNKVVIKNASQFDDLESNNVQNIYQEYTNLVQDPTDLTTGNWVNSNSTDDISTLSINGNLFTKVTNDGANSGYVKQLFTDAFTNLILTGSVIIKKGSSVDNITKFTVTKTGVIDIFRLNIDWDNYPSAPATAGKGVLLDYEWYDSETVKIYFECDTLAGVGDDVEIRCYGSFNATNAEYTYWTEVQLIDKVEITMFPFIDGTHPADVIDETFTMPDKFTFDIKLKPRFAYDTSEFPRVFVWEVDNNIQLKIQYQAGADRYKLFWKDNGTQYEMSSEIFDDGSSFINLNQRIRIIGSINLVSGGQNDSRFIVIPLESGALFEDTEWSGTPDIKTSIISTLSIGNDSGSFQADSNYEYLRIYEGLLVGAVTSSDDVDKLLIGKTCLLNKTYTLASYEYYQGNDNWSPLSMVSEPDWRAAKGDKTLEFNYPFDWKVWDGAEAQDSVPSEVSGTLFNRFPIRVTFHNAPGTAQTADSLTVFHSQYLTQLMDGDIPHQIATHLSTLFLAAGYSIQYSPLGKITGWSFDRAEFFIRGGDQIQTMLTFQGFLCIMKGAAIHGMFGNSVSNWVLKELDTTIGTGYPSSVAVVNQTIFFVGADGYVYGFNGNVSKRISKHIHSDMTTFLASYTPYAIHFESNFYLLLGPNILRFDPDTIREDDLGDGLVSFWKYTTSASGISTLTYPVYFNGDQDNNFLIAQDDSEFIQLETSNYKDVHSGDNNIAIDVKTKDISFGQFGQKKNYDRVKPDVEKAGNWTFTLLSDHESNNVAVTLASGTGPGQYTEDVSVPYKIDGKDLTLRFQNTSAVFAAIYGYALNVARRVF